MHNGGIAEFSKIKRRLQSYLSDELFDFVTGNTGVFTMEYGYRFSSLIIPPRFPMGFRTFPLKTSRPTRQEVLNTNLAPGYDGDYCKYQ